MEDFQSLKQDLEIGKCVTLGNYGENMSLSQNFN